MYQIVSATQHGQAHFAAACLAVTTERLQHFQFGAAYQMVQPVLAYNTDNPAPSGVRDIIGKRIEVVKGSGVVQDLRALRKRFSHLRWKEVVESDSEGLLSRLSAGKTDYVVTESHVLDVVRKFYPNLARAFPIGDPKPLAWMFPRNGDPELVRRAQR